MTDPLTAIDAGTAGEQASCVQGGVDAPRLVAQACSRTLRSISSSFSASPATKADVNPPAGPRGTKKLRA